MNIKDEQIHSLKLLEERKKMEMLVWRDAFKAGSIAGNITCPREYANDCVVVFKNQFIHQHIIEKFEL